MCRKLLFLISIALLLSMVGNASAGQAYFQTTGIWNTTNNWETWDGANRPPSSSDHANLNKNVTCTIDANHTGASKAVCSRLTLPDWQEGTGVCYLSMTGGQLNITNNFEMGRWESGAQLDKGQLDISGGTITMGGHMYVSEDGQGTVNMTGGSIDVNQTLYIPKNAGGLGVVNLSGGTIRAADISMNSNGSLNIEGGTLILEGNDVSTVNTYITNGWIVAYDGNSTVNVEYNGATNLTTLTTASQGQQVWFVLASGTEGAWSDANNWTARKPLTVDTANHNKNDKTCTISSGTTAVCAHMWLSDWQDNSGICTLSMSGGTLTIGSNFELGRQYHGSITDTGTFTISGGTVDVGLSLYVGAHKNGVSKGGTGTINMTGGSINANSLYVPQDTSAVSGTINLDGGTISANSIQMDVNGLIDINDGTLIIDGNVVSTINTYVSNGRITAYNGGGTVMVNYNITNAGKTTVTGSASTSPTKATSPSPANSATGVSITANLSWTAGSYTSSHDVYLGTTFADVNTATKASAAFKSNQAGTTYDPSLSTDTTYYWRIDEVNDTYETTTKGDVWSFTTVSATPTFVAAGAVSSGTGTIAPALPSGIATGDILLLFLETANQAISITNQNGGTWTQVTNSPQGTGTAGGTGATRLTVFWSRYNGTQGAPTASDSGDHQIGRIIAVRGAVATGNPWDVTAGGIEATSDTSGAIPGATATVGNILVVTAIAANLPDATGTANFSAWANSDLTSVTERTDNTVTAGNGGGLGIATGVKSASGAYGSTTVTLANSAVKGMMSIAIKPEAGVSPPGKATAPSPADSATGVSTTANLSWTAGSYTSSHDVYLGTAFADVNTATKASGAFKSNQTGTTYDPSLSTSTTYYWRIDEVNDTYTMTTKGDVWSFTTETAPTGQTVWFYLNSGTSGKWETAANWIPNGPNSYDTANLNHSGKTCQVDATTGSVSCNTIWLPDWQDTSETCTLSMSGGTLTIGSNFELGRQYHGSITDTGTFTISGGTVDVGLSLYVGAHKNGVSKGGIGIINMTGGSIDADSLYVPQDTSAVSGTINLDGGTISAHSIQMDVNGLIDISSGTLIIDGNVVSTINTYVSNGRITAYNGDGTVMVDYNITNAGKTTVTASSPPANGVSITCSASNKLVTVSYTTDAEVRGFALDVNVDNGAKITSVNNVNSKYWVFPGSIDINETTSAINSYGSAVCDGNLPGTLAGLNKNGVTVEMCSLYVTGDGNTPGSSGTLFQFNVDKSCNVTITKNQIRGGVVMKDLSADNANISGCYVP